MSPSESKRRLSFFLFLGLSFALVLVIAGRGRNRGPSSSRGEANSGEPSERFAAAQVEAVENCELEIVALDAETLHPVTKGIVRVWPIRRSEGLLESRSLGDSPTTFSLRQGHSYRLSVQAEGFRYAELDVDCTNRSVSVLLHKENWLYGKLLAPSDFEFSETTVYLLAASVGIQQIVPDSQGKFKFRLPDTSSLLEVLICTPTFPSVSRKVADYSGGELVIEYPPPYEAIEGIVLDQGFLPITGVRVTAVPEGMNRSEVERPSCENVVFTDDDGQFKMKLSPGHYTIKGEDSSDVCALSAAETSIRLPSGNLEPVILQLDSAFIPVTGRVVDESGNAVQGVVLSSCPHDVSTGADGNFEVSAQRLPMPGDVGRIEVKDSAGGLLHIQGPGAFASADHITFDAKSAPLTIIHRKMLEVNGRVVAVDGGPASGANVVIANSTGEQLVAITADASGEFSHWIPHTSALISAHLGKYCAEPTPVAPYIEFQLRECISLSVTVVDSSRAPIKEANVGVQNSFGFRADHPTGINGQAGFDGLSAGNYVISAVPPPNSIFSAPLPQFVSLTDKPVEIELVLEQGGSLEGTVVDPDGTTLQNVTIQGSLNGRLVRTSTDENGFFRFYGFGPSEMLRSVLFRKPGFTPKREALLMADQSPHRVVLAPLSRLTVTVLSEEPINYVEYQIFSSGEGGLSSFPLKRGMARIIDDTFEADAPDAGHSFKLVATTVLEGKKLQGSADFSLDTGNVVVALRSLGSIKGRLVGPSGKAVVSKALVILDGSPYGPPSSGKVVSTTDGFFEFQDVAAGPHLIYAESDCLLNESFPIVVPADEDIVVPLRAVGVLRGKILVSEDGIQPSRIGIRVQNISPDRVRSFPIEIDGDLGFERSGIPSGQYTLGVYYENELLFTKNFGVVSCSDPPLEINLRDFTQHVGVVLLGGVPWAGDPGLSLVDSEGKAALVSVVGVGKFKAFLNRAREYSWAVNTFCGAILPAGKKLELEAASSNLPVGSVDLVLDPSVPRPIVVSLTHFGATSVDCRFVVSSDYLRIANLPVGSYGLIAHLDGGRKLERRFEITDGVDEIVDLADEPMNTHPSPHHPNLVPVRKFASVPAGEDQQDVDERR